MEMPGFWERLSCSSYLRRPKVLMAFIFVIKKPNNVNIIITVILTWLKKEIKVGQAPLMWQTFQLDSSPSQHRLCKILQICNFAMWNINSIENPHYPRCFSFSFVLTLHKLGEMKEHFNLFLKEICLRVCRKYIYF